MTTIQTGYNNTASRSVSGKEENMSESRITVVSMRSKKRRIRFVAAAIVTALLLFSCAHPVQMEEVNSVGRFYTITNDSGIHVVYRDDSGQYQVSKIFSDCQGILMHVTGDITGCGAYGNMLDVMSVEIVN